MENGSFEKTLDCKKTCRVAEKEECRDEMTKSTTKVWATKSEGDPYILNDEGFFQTYATVFQVLLNYLTAFIHIRQLYKVEPLHRAIVHGYGEAASICFSVEARPR